MVRLAPDIRELALTYALYGLQQATLRVDAAHWHRPEDAFVAAAEAVSWVVALDGLLEKADWDRRDPGAYKEARSRTSDGETVIGMKFVRNNVHHAAEMLGFVRLASLVGNSMNGMKAGWEWVPLDELEGLLDSRFISGKGLYRTHLGGRSVVHTLLDANRWFLAVSPRVPPLPSDPTGATRPDFAIPER